MLETGGEMAMSSTFCSQEGGGLQQLGLEVGRLRFGSTARGLYSLGVEDGGLLTSF